MKIGFMDLVGAAEDDVRRWFEHCETERECDDLARVMMESVKAESEERAVILASTEPPPGVPEGSADR